MRFHSSVITGITLLASFSTSLLGLGVAHGEGPDWLIDNQTFTAHVDEAPDRNELSLTNGLIRRTFRIAPNGATVAFDNLITGEALLRGVKPEALVRIDGVDYEVGGLKGQPNYAFLLPEWMDALTSAPNGFQYVGHEIGEPEERMPWKQVRHHAPDSQWPPKGVALRMDYRLSPPPQQDPAIPPSEYGRSVLFKDDFTTLDEGWTLHATTAHPRSSFSNEGKTGEIYTPANTCVYVERPLPEGTRLVETTIDAGTDSSASWGPGMALVWPDHAIKFNLRPGDPGFGVWDGQAEQVGLNASPVLDVSTPWTLRMRLEDGLIRCEARPIGGLWQEITALEIPEGQGSPTAVRIGKMGLRGADEDHNATGELTRLTVESFTAYGEFEQASAEAPEATPEAQKDIVVSVHYELYDGIPVMSKWISVHNRGDASITVNDFTSEILAAVEFGSAVESRAYNVAKPNIHVETDFAFGSFNADDANHQVVRWDPDPEYTSQVNWARQTPCLLQVGPEIGPEQAVAAGDSFESFRTFIMPYDSYDRERKGLALRKMYRCLAPWITENPLMMHARYADWDQVKTAIDQSAEVGFEMVILTFGSGFNIEDDSEAYLAEMKRYADYAHEKGVELGGYSLLASRSISKTEDVVMPEGQSPTFGNSPCIESEWGQEYFRKLYNFYEKTGFNLLEHDGSYPGDPCASTTHPGHTGLGDSQWNQYQRISTFYRWCRSEGIYLNVPDYYYLSGSSKCGMGYREVNWSLPRAQQVIHTRQNIFDGAWEKTGSMGWMFVPLTEYQGGGAAATIEPLEEHLDHYERMMMSNLAMGVQACYRGPRLFDTPRTRAMVQRSVEWYKEYRDILESDMVHGRRADGRNVDWMLHVNPKLEHKGMLVVFNPLPEAVTCTLQPNLYYTGLTDRALIRQENGPTLAYPLKRDYTVEVTMKVPAAGFTWLVIE